MLRRLASLIAASFALTLLIASPAWADKPAGAPDREILVMVKHPVDHYRPGGAYGGGYDDALARSGRERLARRIARAHGFTLVDDWPMPMIGMDCFVLAVPAGLSTTAAAEQVGHDTEVVWAQPVALYQTQSAPVPDNDPLYPAQPAASQWRLAELHRISIGRGVKVAVIDSGIEAKHPDLAGQLLVNRNFVAGQPEASEEHGTGVAGIIAAEANNGIGIAGVAPGARLLGLRACWQIQRGAPGQTVCDSFSLAKALYFAIEEKADVINLSLSGPDDLLLMQLVRTALDHGSTVVAAFDKRRAGGGFPASVPGVIAVSDTALAPMQSAVYTAPGRDVPTTEPGGRWFLVNGSSYAAAHVSGLVALIRQRRPSPALSLVSDRGGTIDACATLLKAAIGCECACGSTASARAEHTR